MTEDPRLSQEESVWHFWYRFLWPFAHFRDVTVCSPMACRQNYRHNRRMRKYLPGFVLKWLALAATSFVCGGYLEGEMELTLPAAGCFMAATWALLVAALSSVCWAWLERFPELS